MDVRVVGSDPQVVKYVVRRHDDVSVWRQVPHEEWYEFIEEHLLRDVLHDGKHYLALKKQPGQQKLRYDKRHELQLRRYVEQMLREAAAPKAAP